MCFRGATVKRHTEANRGHRKDNDVMTNSDMFFHYAKDFQDKRKAISAAYDKRVSDLERMRGSEYYNDELKKAKETKRTALDTLKSEYREHLYNCLSYMSKENGRRGMNPPTQEELRILQLLQMKEQVSERELESAAIALRNNGTCLSVLQEIARRNSGNGIAKDYLRYSEASELSVDSVDAMITGMEKNIRDFMMYDTKRAARVEKERHERMYGADSSGRVLPKRELFSDKAGCYEELAGVSGEVLTAFCKAVDGEGGKE